MKKLTQRSTSLLLAAGLGLAAAGAAWSQESLQDVMKRRGLSQQDLLAASKTYVPTGKRDEFVAFSSGGQSGQVIVYGIPSMRILKYIGVFTPEPWQGYGFDENSKAVLRQGNIDGKEINWGDTHHPAISETQGKYDGQFLFINDKANPRIAVIDLRDFETKQIVVNPIFKSMHGGAFVTPNTEYIIDAAQYAAPLENKKFFPLEEFNEKESFSLELPPYSQDLSDAGKGPSDGWSFTNSFCSERYVGGIEKGRPPYEAGCSAKDTDYLHVINWKKAAELVAQGKAKKINGHNVLMMETAIKEGILFLVPEPKSPHGVDVTPDGKLLTVAGKLDTHVSVYSFEKIMAAIKAGKFESKDPYGIPVIGMKDALHTQVSLGLGPLHTQYDSKPCIAYTSLYVDSQVAKWNYCEGKVLDKISVHYNIGHLMTMEGDSTKPAGKYLVALNKLAIDRFVPVGPLHPQNHQLIDISGDKMQLLYDMPIPLGEPHYVVAIDAKKLKPAVRYKVGTDSRTDKAHPGAVRAGEEKTVKKGNKVEVFATLIRSHITPETIEVDVGDEVTINLTNLERAQDETHGFTVSTYNVHASVEPGKTVAVKFKADKEGVYPYYCTEFCSALHLEMQGYLLVKPKGWKPTKTTLAKGTYTEADYKATVKKVVDTQAIIDSVVAYITSVNYKDFPDAVAMVEDAFDQLGKTKGLKEKHEEFAARKDWENANLWAEQIWQYQVKTADLGLRAKTYLEQNGAKKVK
ncbi:MAG: Sec-dependent nitrous-oxide reductase [Rhodocyclaceae bacterium]|nr:Sec-dependent nitrous-oxide reductase [Rhodocyclaceae bacterium]